MAEGNIELTRDNRIYKSLSNANTFTVTIPTTDGGYRYGLLIYGDGRNMNQSAVYLFGTSTTEGNVINLTPIWKGESAKTVTATISGQTITLTFSETIYGGIRMLFLV